MDVGLQSGSLLGRYRLVKRIAQGGMGTVWVARDVRLERDVAVKVLPRMLVRDSSAQRRFEREARALARLQHPNVVSVFDIGSADPGTGEELPFLVMELIRGRSLDLELREGAMEPARAVVVFRQVARALGAAHRAGVVHRDLKPSNIMITEQDHIKVLDFGLARLVQQDDGVPEESLTTPGMVLGSCPYMAPEQALGRGVSPASDIFSCGSVLYEALSGQRAFEGETPMHVLQSVVKCQLKPLDELEPNTPPDLLAIVERCLKQDPAKRYADGVSLANDLDAVADDLTSTITKTPTIWLGASAVEAVREKRRRAVLRWSGVVAGLLAVGLTIGGLWGRWGTETLRPDPGAWVPREILRVSGGLRHPSWNSLGNQLVIEWIKPEGAEVGVLSISDQSYRPLIQAEPGQNIGWPSFSPDDRAVVVTILDGDSQAVHVLPAVGGAATAEISNAMHGTWLDENRVAFSRMEEDGSGIWVVDLETGEEELALPPEGDRWWWFAKRRPGGGFAVLGGATDLHAGIYVGRRLEPPLEEWLAPGRSQQGFDWDVNGRSLVAAVESSLRRITSKGADQLLPRGAKLSEPEFSPDGKSLAVVQTSGRYDLLAVSPDGQEPTCLNCNVPGSGWGSVAADGTLVYRRERSGQLALFLRSDDSERMIVSHEERGSCPSFSPRDGDRIAYLSKSQSEGVELRVVPRTGGEPVTLAADVEGAEFASWSPDGRYLAYAGGTPTSIWVVSAAGGKPRLLTPAGGDYPKWSPDGRWIAYVIWTEASDPNQGAWIIPAEGGEPQKIGNLPTQLVWSKDSQLLWQLRRNGQELELWQCSVGEWRWTRRSQLNLGGPAAPHQEYMPVTLNPRTGDLVFAKRITDSSVLVFDGVDPARW